MAKCIQEKATSLITRVSNDEADQRVKAGTHGYVSKSDWKRQRAVVSAHEAEHDKHRHG